MDNGMKRTRLSLTIAVILSVSSFVLAQNPPADLIITHADVYTLDAKHPHAEAVAVRAGKIVFVGSAKAAEKAGVKMGAEIFGRIVINVLRFTSMAALRRDGQT